MDAVDTTYEIRELFGADLEQLAPLGIHIPYPNFAMALAAYEDGQIVGCSVFQLVPHVGDLWVEPKHRGNGLTKDLAKRVIDFARALGGPFLCIAQSPFTGPLAEDNGMKPLDGQLWKGGA